jgi:hypothetical protein
MRKRQYTDDDPMEARDNARVRVLDALKRAGSRGLTSWELIHRAEATEAPRRVRELVASGVPITVVHEAGTCWRYTLTSSVDPLQPVHARTDDEQPSLFD